MADEEDTAGLTPGGGAAGQGHGHGQGQGQGNIVCSGCAQSLEETSDSVVVSFGDGLWHIDW
jgi:Rac GTPase-activating protein 1